MAKLIRNNFFYHIRTLHKSAVTCNIPAYDLVKEKKDFNNVLAEVTKSLMTDSKLSELPEVGNWVKQLLDYTLSGGRQSRGLCVPMTYQMLEAPKNLTEENLRSARVLGWCLEMLQAYFCLFDDMIDGSTRRRGKTCWYRLPNIGHSAINDAILLHQSVMETLKINFEKSVFYPDAVVLFNNAILYTAMGEYFDTSSTYNKETENLDQFTMDRFNTMAMYINSYSFRLPIFSAQLLLKDGKENDTEKWDEICRELGKYCHMKNDYTDVYDDERVTKKVGTDIEEGKRTWLAVTALQRCNEDQRSIFKEYYGSKHPEHVKRIKQLYDELNLPLVYKQQDRTMYEEIMRQINALPSEREINLFSRVLDDCQKMKY